MLRQLIQQGVAVAALRVAGTGISMLVTIILARFYGPSELGLYAYCVSMLGILGVWVSNGWATLIIRRVGGKGFFDPKAFAMERYASITAFINMTLVMLVGLLFLRFAGNLGPFETARNSALFVLAMLGLIFLCDQLAALRMAGLRALDRPVLGQTPEMFVRPTVLGIGLVLFAYFEVGPDKASRLFGAVAIAASGSYLVGRTILKRIVTPESPMAVSSNTRAEWIKSVLLLSSSAGLILINGNVDLLILGAYYSSEELGLYKSALQIALLANFGYTALNMLAAQRFSQAISQGTPTAQQGYAKIMSRLALLCAVPLPIILFFIGPELFGFLLGPEFVAASTPALIIACAYVVSSAFGMTRTLLIMRGGEKFVVKATLLALIFNAALCMLLIPQQGMYGAAFANALSLAVWNLMLWIQCRRLYGIDASVVGLANITIDTKPEAL